MSVEIVIVISLLANVAQFFYLVFSDAKHLERESEQRMLNRALREELVDLIRRGRVIGR